MTEQIKDCNTCANATEDFNNDTDNGCYMCSKGYKNNYKPNMTEIKSVIERLETSEKYCVVPPTEDFKLAIRSLSAWDEVIDELEGQADFANCCGDTEEELGIKGAIDIIKQKLAEIEQEEKIKGYKAFNKNLACRGMQYEVGQTYEMSESPVCCERGYHFCKNIADVYEYYDMSDDTRICEVIALGEVVTDDNKKYCTNKIKIVKEIKSKSIKHCNVDKTDVGYCNSGYCNSGNRNSGDWNSGDCNSGYWNSGNRNSGNRNSGDWNSGDWNSGDWNSGYCNSGDWNSGDWNSGVFNTSKNPTIKMFDKESDWTINDWNNSDVRNVLNECPHTYSNFVSENNMTDEEREKHPEYKTIGGYVKTFVATKEDKQKWWDSLSEEDKEECYNLPNFNADKFIECLGIEHI